MSLQLQKLHHNQKSLSAMNSKILVEKELKVDMSKLNIISDDDFEDFVPDLGRPRHPQSHVTPKRRRGGEIDTIKPAFYGDTVKALKTRKIEQDDKENFDKNFGYDGGPPIKKNKNVRGKVKVVQYVDDEDSDVNVKEKAISADSNPFLVPPVFKTWDFYVPKEKRSNRSISVHTNEHVAKDLKECLSDGLLQKFRETCFGHFLDMPKFMIQNQLLVHLLFREVAGPSDDVLWFSINDKKLKFGMQEFALVTGLRCEGDYLKDYTSPIPNRLVLKYFNGTSKVSKSALKDCFLQKKWDNEEDAIKLAALYFIHTYLFSIKNDSKNPSIIPYEDFNLVDSGEWQTFPWGTKLWITTFESLHDKVRVKRSMYRLAGFPYALQLWFYESCPTVHGKIATRVGDTIPRIHNWSVTRHVGFHELQSGIFSLPRHKIVLNNIFPTDLERSMIDLPQDTLYHIKEDLHDAPGNNIPELESKAQPSNVTDQASGSANRSNDIKMLYEGQRELRNEIADIRKNVDCMNEYMVLSFERILKGMQDMTLKSGVTYDPKPNVEHQKDGFEDQVSFEGFGSDIDTVPHLPEEEQVLDNSKKDPKNCAHEDDAVNLADDSFWDNTTWSQLHQLTCDAREELSARKDKFTPTKEIKDHTRAEADWFPNFSLGISQLFQEEGEDGDVAEIQASQHKIGGETEGLNIGKKGQLEADQDEAFVPKNQTPKQTVRARTISKFKRSPFINTFRESGNTTKKLLSMKHPFLTNIWRPIDKELLGRFNTWIDRRLRTTMQEPYANSVNILNKPFDLGVYSAGTKEWFHILNYDEKPLAESHIDVLFYYLRKKGKYDPQIYVSFTTTDCNFDAMIREFYDLYLHNNKCLGIFSGSHVISDYMKGHFMRCNVPWHEVDHVLFPVKIVHDWHWSLGRLSFKDRNIYVYDSKLDNDTYDMEVTKAMEPYRVIIPIFLSEIGFYSNRDDLNNAAYEFGEKPETDPFDVLHTRDMGGIHTKDYAVMAAVVAEYFIHGHEMPGRRCDLRRLRRRYGAFLWDYAAKKNRQNASSDSELN